MTAALVKKCNKCQKQFLKESGCNKMTCSCGNSQCYICSTNVVGYDHFGNNAGRCPLFDDTTERERREVAVAQRQAVLNVLAARHDVTENDLTVDQNLRADIQGQKEHRGRKDLGRQIQLGIGRERDLMERERIGAKRERQRRLREQRQGEQLRQRPAHPLMPIITRE